MPTLIEDFSSIIVRAQTWALMANQDIGLRYRRSIIGPFWISIAMVAMVLGIGTLYAEIMKQPYVEFLTYFGCGILAWTLLSTMITESCLILTESESHLRSVPIPIPLLAARMVYRNFVIFLHNAVVILIMLALFGHNFTPVMILALLGVFAYLFVGLTAAIVLGPLCARFRDITQLVATVMQILFFLTPIFWVPGASLSRPIVLDLNPFYHLIEIVRKPLMGEFPSATNWSVTLGLLVVLGVAAVIVQASCRKKVYQWL